MRTRPVSPVSMAASTRAADSISAKVTKAKCKTSLPAGVASRPRLVRSNKRVMKMSSTSRKDLVMAG